MINLFSIISITCLILSLVIFIITIIPFIKMHNKLSKLNPNEVLPKPLNKKAIILIILMLVGSFLCILSSLITMFLRFFS